MTHEPTAFDLRGPLPTGTTLIEASAGTGKTYTIAALVTRYVAEGVARLEELLVITFSRAASQELRERVREALVSAQQALADPGAANRDDPVIGLLLQLPDRATVTERVRDAVAGFDAATIATTHQFCQLVLRSLGVAGDSDPGAELVETLTDLVDEVVDDLYLARFAGNPKPPITHAEARRLGQHVIGDPQSRIVPDELDPTTRPGARAELAVAVRAEVERRKRHQGLLSYDDLLSRLAEALHDERAPARARMRDRWRVVLVDEFQDTDPVQWRVISRAFTGHATVTLVGDPKQAIYAFRGGDVVAYLDAARHADSNATLAFNHRADPALVRSLQAVLAGAELGDPMIRVHQVAAARADDRLAGAPSPAPWRLRVLERNADNVGPQGDLIPVDAARAAIAQDCAADISRLLSSGATWDGRPLTAPDVAVLVHERRPAALVQAALKELGIASVLAGAGDILQTPAADAWVSLLTAMEQPHRSGLVHAAALTPFVGQSAAGLVRGGEQLTDEVAERLREWALLWRGHGGIAAVLEAAEHRGLAARVLATVGGERLLTDLRHTGQLLHEAAVRERLGPSALLAWLHESREREASGTERTRRLDSDADAVQILTVHASKGLQFPVVYLPFEFESFVRSDDLVRFHDEQGQRCLDVAGAGPSWREHESRARAEDAGERLRLLYVALTRAQSQVVCWWAATINTPASGLHRLLLERQPGQPHVPPGRHLRSDAETVQALQQLSRLGGPTCEPARPESVATEPIPVGSPELTVRRLGREIDTHWRRTSYSGLIRIEDEQPAGTTSEPETVALDDEPEESTSDGGSDGIAGSGAGPSGTEGSEPNAIDILSPMAGLPAGAGFGSLVHAVLEHTDPQAPDLPDEVRRHVTEQARWWPVEVSPDELAAALLPMYATPLGPLAGDVTLAQVPQRDRLNELSFEFPLSGGDQTSPEPAGPESTPAGLAAGRAGRAWRADVRLREVGALIRAHLSDDDPLVRYAERLETPLLGDQVLRGYLSGSIDTLLRVPDPSSPGSHRYLVVDYKTNRLGDPTRPLTAADYGPAPLAEAMLHSHYPLQALIYSVVAQRFLRWRLPGCQPERHWGGVLYLFVRGMCGPGTPVIDGHRTGVFSWRPPVRLIEALSDLFAGGLPITGPEPAEQS
ncbi:MAG: exodeoxyribonuclease V subunit beta [Actinomycetales bacterium]|nr:MAG: exodeoxyribonuclease V subunit beta [Actinomycetales bacterium]